MATPQFFTAAQLAGSLGVKALLYGGPGSGKTPTLITAPNPVLLATEPGLLSIRNSNITCVPAYSEKQIDEFIAWWLGSKERDKFDTLCVDSISQLAETILDGAHSRNRDGRAAYGDMERKVMYFANALYFMPNKHVALLAKQELVADDAATIKRPYFPGKSLNVKIPHLFDEILYVVQQTMTKGPNAPAETKRVVKTRGDASFVARDRSGMLAAEEPADLNYIIKKCLQKA